MKRVTFGTTLGGFGSGLASGETLCQWAEDIESLGYDVLFYRDHVLWHSPVLDPFTMLGAFAARTKTIRLGTGVLLLPLRNPTLVAKMASTLDWLSNGRAILGVGVGGEFEKEYEACGISLKERGARATEGLRVIKTLWAGSPARFEGKHFNVDGLRIRRKHVSSVVRFTVRGRDPKSPFLSFKIPDNSLVWKRTVPANYRHETVKRVIEIFLERKLELYEGHEIPVQIQR